MHRHTLVLLVCLSVDSIPHQEAEITTRHSGNIFRMMIGYTMPMYNTRRATITGQQKQYLSNTSVLHPECKGYGTNICVRLCGEAKEQSIIIERFHSSDRG
jgi:hypothetical protein